MLKTTSVGHIRRQHVSLHICTSSAQFLSEVTAHCLLHGFLAAHLLVYSWCINAQLRVGNIIVGR